MRIEVDQSGKIEDLRQDTIVAFSNETQFSVSLSRNLKRDIFKEFRKKIKHLKYKLFAICIFYTIKDYISDCDLIIIDKEYEGKEAFIKGPLISLMRDKFENFNKKQVRFSLIGRGSKAHYVAYRVKRKIDNPNKLLIKKEIIRYLK
ncbi:hypothetical protein B6U80_00490 [Candidatus Pacearchaeota archaeon ex4484_26]|nr:MAG: hypothetical protein B6U80_00490 [Candidatus Pacearchaeota archaeon ex4484_26]